MFNYLKNTLKSFLAKKGIKLQRYSISRYILFNVFKTQHQKNVLFVHFISPFLIGESFKHTSESEAIEIANVFNKLGFNVDVINWDDNTVTLNDIDVSKYSIIFGQGFFMEKILSYEKIHDIITIYYATGCHTLFLQQNAIKRLQRSYHKTQKYLINSMIFNTCLPLYHSSLVDYIFVWGNDFTKNTYINYYFREKERIIKLPAFFHKTTSFNIDTKDCSTTRTHFLFFGSSGLIHRGLDLLIEYFSTQPTLTLHICGSILQETSFYETYQKIIESNNNIIVHGFIDINSEKFISILNQCAFYIYPSASEGTSASALTVIGNGGLVPILTRECSIDIDDFGIYIDDFTFENIHSSVQKALDLPIETIKEYSINAYKKINKLNTRLNFSRELHYELQKILITKNI